MFLVVAFAMLVAVITALVVRKWIRMPRKSKAFGKSVVVYDQVRQRSVEVQQRRTRIVNLLAEIMEETKLFPRSEKQDVEVNKMLISLDKKSNGMPLTLERVYLWQCGAALGSVGLAIMTVIAMSIGFGAFTPAGFLLILSAPILYQLPIRQLKGEFLEDQLRAMSQWLEFYNMYYSQYIQPECHTLLIDIVDNYLPLANDELSRLLKRFRSDLDNGGDDYALDRLKNRYPDNIRIHKFVSVAKMRATGDRSAFDLMRSVQEDLLFDEDQAYLADQNSKMKKSDRVILWVLIISLILLFSVMIYAMWS